MGVTKLTILELLTNNKILLAKKKPPYSGGFFNYNLS